MLKTKHAIIAILLGIFIFAGCGKRPDAEEPAIYARGYQLPDLVTAANAPVFDPGGAAYAEAVWTGSVWKIHDGGKWFADGRSEDEMYQAMKVIRAKRPESRIVISAGADTAFGEIVKMIRGMARAGFWRLDFLVATGSPGRLNHSFILELPSGPTLDIDPFLISIDAKGSFFSGTGSARASHDSDPEDHALPKLSSLLELYAAAARAAESQPVCMVHADPTVNYQRVIDLLSRFHEYRITNILFTDLAEAGLHSRIEEERKKRSDLLKNKPRPVAPSSPSRPPNP